MKILWFEIKYVGPVFKFVTKKRVLDVWVAKDSKIWAIKEHRHLTGSSLKEAKLFCDDLQERAERLISDNEYEKDRGMI